MSKNMNLSSVLRVFLFSNLFLFILGTITLISCNKHKVVKPLPGVFTVNSSGKKVQFSKGNLYWDGTKYAFEEHQYDYPTTRNADHIGHFFYSKNAVIARANSYSDTLATTSDVFFAVNGGAIEGYTVLTSDEWQYLIDHNMQSEAAVAIAGINCAVLVPDGYTGSVASSYTEAEWAAAEAEGMVAIPYAGLYYFGRYEVNIGSNYWSYSLNQDNLNEALSVLFYPDIAHSQFFNGRCIGSSVRLVVPVQ